MGFSDKLKRFISNSREKHKLSFIDDSTYREKWSVRVSVFNIYSLIALYTLVVFLALFFLIRYTAVQHFFIEAPPSASVQQINQNSTLIDSLTKQIESRQKYINDLKMILTGQSFKDSLNEGLQDSTFANYESDFIKSKEDSLLREKIENVDKAAAGEVSYEFFFAPVKGTVSKPFSPQQGHYGVDVVTLKDEAVKSCLEGTVVFSGWTTNDGIIIIIQHKNNLISVYKHCQSSLKTVGDMTQTADPVGVVGNSGKHTSGPHLHFELWKNGQPLDPQAYISFKK